jgi:hypothetical protein
VRHLFARFVGFLCLVCCAGAVAIGIAPVSQAVRTSDENGDGRPDIWRRYDTRGQLTEVDVDTNFDGSPDIEEYYEKGVLVRRESDRNFNGQADLVEEFDAETHGQTRSVVDIDYDGTADLLVLFRDGRPVFSKRTSPPKGSGGARPHAPADHRDASHLAQLADPFESELAIRRARTTQPDEVSVGLSTTGGLPAPRVTAFYGLSPSAHVIAADTPGHLQALQVSRSPRAPPVSNV